MVGITGYGAYIPRRRLSRASIVAAHQWADPGLASKGRGERSMCNWDEDCVTMAVEAARSLPVSAEFPALYFASTSAPFADRQHSAVLATALGLPESIASIDLACSQRAGTSGLVQAMAAVKGGIHDGALLIASDHRRAKAASSAELNFGDAAAAVAIGNDNTIFEFVATSTATVDFIDHFRAATAEYDYEWEERWIRDEGLAKIVPRAIATCLKRAGVAASDVQHFVMSSTIGRAVKGVATSAGLAAETIVDDLMGQVGEAGTAHPLLMLCHAAETRVQPDDLVLVVGFGQGCDAILLRATEHLAGYRAVARVDDALEAGVTETNYQKFLAFNDLIALEKGMRAENDDYKTALTVNYRKRDMLTGLIGGRCTQCDTLQFPRTDVCVNPQCRAHHTQEPHPFRDEPASVLTWSADYLAYSADPPSHYGMVTFDNGGRFMTDITDVEPGDVDVGMPVRMVFRIKSRDSKRGFTRYFWKAVPVRDISASENSQVDKASAG